MAENAKIAALRATSPAAPQGASGPQQLAYEWMTRRGSDLVLPTRAASAPPAPPGGPKSRRPPEPTPPTKPPGTMPPGTLPPPKSVLPPGVEPPVTDPGVPPGFEPPVYDLPVYGGPVEPIGEPFAPIEREPSYFNPDPYTYMPEPVTAPSEPMTPPSEPVAPPSESFNFNPYDLNFFGNISAPEAPAIAAPQPEAAVEPIDPALLNMLAQEQDPMARMQNAYANPYARMARSRFMP